MPLSIHDNLLVSYEVQCEARTIVLRTERRTKNQPATRVNVIFNGVQAYRFENDAFGNIIVGLESVALDGFLTEFGIGISSTMHRAAWVSAWGDRHVPRLDVAIPLPCHCESRPP
jgi:hypothetical protein